AHATSIRAPGARSAPNGALRVVGTGLRLFCGFWLGRPLDRGGLAALTLLLALGQSRDRREPLTLLEVDEPDSLGVAPDDPDLVGAQADHLAAAGHQHELVLVGHHAHPDDSPGLLGDSHGADALAAAMGAPVLVHAGALAVAVLRYGEERGSGLDEVDGDHLVTLVELHADDAVGRPAHGARLGLLEADRLALGGGQDDLARAVGEPHAGHLRALLQRDRDQAGRSRRRVLHEVRLLDQAAPGCEHEVATLLELPYGQEGGELLLGLQAEQVGHAPAACRAPRLGDLVDLEPVDLA